MKNKTKWIIYCIVIWIAINFSNIWILEALKLPIEFITMECILIGGVSTCFTQLLYINNTDY